MPGGDEEDIHFKTDTAVLHLVSQYTLMNFEDVLKLDCVTYKILVRDAIVEKFSSSEEGRDYLEQCWVLTQTKPDRDALRKKLGDKNKC